MTWRRAFTFMELTPGTECEMEGRYEFCTATPCMTEEMVLLARVDLNDGFIGSLESFIWYEVQCLLSLKNLTTGTRSTVRELAWYYNFVFVGKSDLRYSDPRYSLLGCNLGGSVAVSRLWKVNLIIFSILFLHIWNASWFKKRKFENPKGEACFVAELQKQG